LKDFQDARLAGNPVDYEMLRRYLLIDLEVKGKLALLKENGGNNSFGESWEKIL